MHLDVVASLFGQANNFKICVVPLCLKFLELNLNSGTAILTNPSPHDEAFPPRIFAKEMHVVDWSQVREQQLGIHLMYGHPDTWAMEDDGLLWGLYAKEAPYEGKVYRVGPPKEFCQAREITATTAKMRDCQRMTYYQNLARRVHQRQALARLQRNAKSSEQLWKDPEFRAVAEFHEDAEFERRDTQVEEHATAKEHETAEMIEVAEVAERAKEHAG